MTCSPFAGAVAQESGTSGGRPRWTIAGAFEAYVGKPKRPHSSDVLRIGIINEVIGAMPLADPEAAWRTF